MDNAPSHPNESVLKSDDGLIVVKFLPPNVTSILQPMDQGVISSMKRHYRAGLLRTLAIENENLLTFWKNMTVLDAIEGINQAWLKVKPITLARSWRKILRVEGELSNSFVEDTFDVSEIVPAIQNLKEFNEVDTENLTEWLLIDSKEPGYEFINDDDIITIASKKSQANVEDSEENDEEDIEEVSNRISNTTALSCIDTLTEYLTQCDFEYNDIIALRKIRTDVKKKINDSLKQRKITDYVTKFNK